MMKRLSVILIAIVALILPLTVSAKRQSAESGTPAITFKEKTHDFGTIKEADGVVEYKFAYTNTGTAPLVIVTVSATCGCTVPDFDTKPLAPGKSGEVTIRFAPKGQRGEFDKRITVRTNVRGQAGKPMLRIKGVIIPASND